jgi:hypothetical protein
VTPSPGPTLLARGTFENKGFNVELDATGEGSDVQGAMTWSSSEDDSTFTVDLQCTRTLPSGLVLIGGEVTDTSFEYAPERTRVAIVIKPGSPVQAHPDFENPDPPAASCMAYLEDIDQARAADQLETITVGSIELGP